MAVFTKLKKIDVENFLNSYEIGKLDSFEEIVEGIENTNYKIICESKNYILTIFEKRVDERDLPFFIDLKFHLNKNEFLCPRPIFDKNKNVINELMGKKAVIVTFLEGVKIKDPTETECLAIGEMIGKLHVLTRSFKNKRANSLDKVEWGKIFNKCKISSDTKFKEIFDVLSEELKTINAKWPKNLPSGIIHADLFYDNIFFNNNKISGIIDFYFSCYDIFIYDIAIAINDSCFNKYGVFKKNRYDAIINGYNKSRKLDNNEMQNLNVVLRGAAVRIIVTRLHDYIFHPQDAVVIKKDPLEYLNILNGTKQIWLMIYDYNIY